VRSLLRVCIPRRRDYANQLIASEESHKSGLLTNTYFVTLICMLTGAGVVGHSE
jgi:hypothetical protein